MSDTQKISGAAVMNALAEIRRAVDLFVNPEPMFVYKPTKSGSGGAVKLDCRLTPIINERGYIGSVDGGLFVELVAQEGEDDAGFPTFGWQNPQTRVIAKLGVPDVTAILLGIREVRLRGKKVPEGVRPRSKKNGAWEVDSDGLTVGLTHKFENEVTIVQYKFGADGSFLSVSKSAQLRRSIKLSLAEEVQLAAYLEMTLRAFLAVGK